MAVTGEFNENWAWLDDTDDFPWPKAEVTSLVLLNTHATEGTSATITANGVVIGGWASPGYDLGPCMTISFPYRSPWIVRVGSFDIIDGAGRLLVVVR